MRKGSIREKSKPVISLKNLSEKGIIVIPKTEYRIADPTPNSWVMIKPGDIIISTSGTIRLILKKNWQEGQVESLRITWEEHDERLEASLEVENMEIDSSNFDHLNIALRPYYSSDISPTEYKPEFFTRAVKYNVLTFLGFGKIGDAIHSLMPAKGDKRAPEKFSLVFILDTANNKLVDVYSANSNPENSTLKKANCVEIAVLWKRHERIRSYQISDIAYPPGVMAGTLETVTLASEIANAFSLANEIHSISAHR